MKHTVKITLGTAGWTLHAGGETFDLDKMSHEVGHKATVSYLSEQCKKLLNIGKGSGK